MISRCVCKIRMQDAARCVFILLPQRSYPNQLHLYFSTELKGKWTGQHHIVGSKAIVTTHRWRISPNAMVTMSFLGFWTRGERPLLDGIMFLEWPPVVNRMVSDPSLLPAYYPTWIHILEYPTISIYIPPMNLIFIILYSSGLFFSHAHLIPSTFKNDPMDRSNDGGEVRSLALSPDGSLFASGAADSSVRLWALNPSGLRRAQKHGLAWQQVRVGRPRFEM